MPDSKSFLPGRAYPYWLRVDYDTLLNNIASHCHDARLIDLTVPFLLKIWSRIEDDLLRAGIDGVLSSDPQALLNVSPSLQRILRPGFRPGETGYAREGLLPVLGSWSECLNLSNTAQIHDQRLPFLLRARSRIGEYGAGDWGLESICEQLHNVPMIDLLGFYTLRQPDPGETAILRRILRRLEAENAMLCLPLASVNSDFKEFRPFLTWETVAIERDGPGCFPVEIGFWAFPVHSGPDYQVFQADIGRLHGLPAGEFPAKIGGYNARISDIQPTHSEFVVEDHLPGPFPAAGFLTGGDAHEPVDLRLWKATDLKNLLAHLDHCPLYLQKDKQIIEIPA